jgi:putative sugar O-methyltransferase
MENAAPLAPGDCRTRVSGPETERLRPGEHRLLDVVVENRGPVPLTSNDPQLVFLASRWFQSSGTLVGDGPRTRLVPPLRPAEARRCRVRIVAPEAPGDYIVRITALQELVGWFDDFDRDNGWSARVRVEPGPGGPAVPDDLPQLAAMAAEVAAGPEALRPSAFWEDFSGLHLALLRDEGFTRFKRSINQTYFQFMVLSPRDEQFRAVLRSWLAHPRLDVLRARLAEPVQLRTDLLPGLRTRSERFWYARYVAALWEEVSRRDRHRILEQLEEPRLGAPIAVRHRGRFISQDLCNSALELVAILDGLEPAGLPVGARVIEVGGGYGRVAWAALTVRPDLRVVLVDIPPALAVAERYLTTLFPHLPTLRFRRFEDPREIEDALRSAQLAFLTPNQLERLEPLEADLAINISSLHEMRPDQIERQLELIDRQCRGHFYTKQWEAWHNVIDDVTIRRQDYPYPSRWRPVFERRHPVQRGFFEALLATRSEPDRGA